MHFRLGLALIIHQQMACLPDVHNMTWSSCSQQTSLQPVGKKENSAVIHRSTVTVYVLRLQEVVLLKPAGKLAIHIIGNMEYS